MKLSCHREYNILSGQLWCEENKVAICYEIDPSSGDHGRFTVLPENLCWFPSPSLVSFLSFSIALCIPGSCWDVSVAYLGCLYLETVNYLESRSNSFPAHSRSIHVLNTEWVKYFRVSWIPEVCLMYTGVIRSSQVLIWFQHHRLT